MRLSLLLLTLGLAVSVIFDPDGNALKTRLSCHDPEDASSGMNVLLDAHGPEAPDPWCDDDTNPIVEGDLGPELDALLAGCAEWGFSGSVLVSRDDRVILRNGYGLADRAAAAPNAPDTLFEIASVSKHFTCVAILQLEEAGRLSTADSIRRWLPSVPEEHAGVTIDHLLTHTSGFPRMGPVGAGVDADAALRDYLAGGRVREPGVGFEYWNGGYALLAMIVERASGTSLEAYCREHLFVPAGMASTGFCGETRFDERRLAHGYQDGGDVGHAASHSFGWEYRGMGGIVTSVADLARWDRALRHGRILRSTGKLESADASGYAGGGWIDKTPLGTPQIMLAGNVIGFNSQVWRMPEENAMVAVLCNNLSYGMVVCMHLARRLYGRTGMLSMPPRSAKLDAGVLAALGGRYVAEDGSALVIRPSEDGIMVGPWGQSAVQLIMAGDPAIPPHIASTIETATAIVTGIIEGDDVPFRSTMADEIPGDWPERFRGWWESRVAEHGPADAASLEVVGARGTAMSPTSLEVMMRVRHERGESIFDLVFESGRMFSCRLDRPAPVVEFRYVPTAAARLERYVLGPGATASIEIDTAQGHLVVRGTGGSTMIFRKR